MDIQRHESPLAHRRVLKLARDYRRQGYDVTIYPGSADLPEGLSPYSLDLIVRGRDQVIAVEVRTRETLTLGGFEDLCSMADAVKQIPGWIFELVVTNPRKSHGAIG